MRRLALIATLGVTLVAAAAAAGASFDQVDVSKLSGSQAEVAIAADPAHPGTLLAASNSLDFRSTSTLANLMRTYTSTDDGATWTVAPGPTAAAYGGRRRCDSGDPAPTIDAGGREYIAFLASQCLALDTVPQSEDFNIARLEVATRPDATSPWQVSQVFPVRSARFDDKPAIAVDTSATSPHFGRVYVAWTRITPGATHRVADLKLLIVVSHSDDNGATWTKPVVVPDSIHEQGTFAGLAVDMSGTLFVSWSDVDRQVLLDRSTDGGDTFGHDVVAVPGSLPVLFCAQPGSFRLVAQARRCLTPTPMVVVDSRPGVAERVYVTYSAPDATGKAQDVLVSAFDASLVPLGSPHPVHPPDARRDEFMSASAVDDQGRLWVCYYDTGADRSRRTTRYTCTASVDGGVTFATPRAVATVASNETVSPALPFQYGDYEGLAVANGVAHPMWTDSRDLHTNGEEIYTSTLTAADLQLP